MPGIREVSFFCLVSKKYLSLYMNLFNVVLIIPLHRQFVHCDKNDQIKLTFNLNDANILLYKIMT